MLWVRPPYELVNSVLLHTAISLTICLCCGIVTYAAPVTVNQFGYSRTDAVVTAIDPKDHRVTFQPVGRNGYKPPKTFFWVAADVVFSRQGERGARRRAAFKDLRVGDRVLLSGPGGINNAGQATEVIIILKGSQ
jgi:hypothetical protein